MFDPQNMTTIEIVSWALMAALLTWALWKECKLAASRANEEFD